MGVNATASAGGSRWGEAHGAVRRADVDWLGVFLFELLTDDSRGALPAPKFTAAAARPGPPRLQRVLNDVIWPHPLKRGASQARAPQLSSEFGT